jgi:hypothetical protein
MCQMGYCLPHRSRERASLNRSLYKQAMATKQHTSTDFPLFTCLHHNMADSAVILIAPHTRSLRYTLRYHVYQPDCVLPTPQVKGEMSEPELVNIQTGMATKQHSFSVINMFLHRNPDSAVIAHTVAAVYGPSRCVLSSVRLRVVQITCSKHQCSLGLGQRPQITCLGLIHIESYKVIASKHCHHRDSTHICVLCAMY